MGDSHKDEPTTKETSEMVELEQMIRHKDAAKKKPGEAKPTDEDRG